MSAAFCDFIMDDVTLADMWRPPDARKKSSDAAELGSKGGLLGKWFKPHTARQECDQDMVHDIDQQVQQVQQVHGSEQHADIELAAAAAPGMNNLHASQTPTATHSAGRPSAVGSAAAGQDESSRGAVKTAAAAQESTHPSGCQVSGRQQLLQILEREGSLSVLTGPCMFPGYVLQRELPEPATAAGAGHAATAAGSGHAASFSAACARGTADGVASEQHNQGASCSRPAAHNAAADATAASIPPDFCWQSVQHPIWLRSYSLCVLYSIDIGVLRALSQVCPQLYDNLAKLTLL
jgi:hypothetical protein